jgi:hypothetical protein
MFLAGLDREIQSGSIGADLAARYDFSKHFEKLVVSAFQFGQRPSSIPCPGVVPNDALMLSRQRGSNKALNLCPYKRGVPRAPCQKRKISTVRRDSAMR